MTHHPSRRTVGFLGQSAEVRLPSGRPGSPWGSSCQPLHAAATGALGCGHTARFVSGLGTPDAVRAWSHARRREWLLWMACAQLCCTASQQVCPCTLPIGV